MNIKNIKIIPVSKIKLRYHQECSVTWCDNKAQYLVKYELTFSNVSNSIVILKNKFWICEAHKGVDEKWAIIS